jgi:hypothetical protein
MDHVPWPAFTIREGDTVPAPITRMPAEVAEDLGAIAQRLPNSKSASSAVNQGRPDNQLISEQSAAPIETGNILNSLGSQPASLPSTGEDCQRAPNVERFSQDDEQRVGGSASNSVSPCILAIPETRSNKRICVHAGIPAKISTRGRMRSSRQAAASAQGYDGSELVSNREGGGTRRNQLTPARSMAILSSRRMTMNSCMRGTAPQEQGRDPIIIIAGKQGSRVVEAS